MLPLEIQNIVQGYLETSPHVKELELVFSLVRHFCVGCVCEGRCFLNFAKSPDFRRVSELMFAY